MYPHTGFAIEETLVSCLTEWGIRNKLFTLTVDNASNNTSACEELVDTHKHELMLEGAHLHVRCCAHILNILVQDGMKIIHEGIKKIRELLKHIDSSPSRIQAFNQIAIVNGLPTKVVLQLIYPIVGIPPSKWLEKHSNTKLSSIAIKMLKLPRMNKNGQELIQFVGFLKPLKRLQRQYRLIGNQLHICSCF